MIIIDVPGVSTTSYAHQTLAARAILFTGTYSSSTTNITFAYNRYYGVFLTEYYYNKTTTLSIPSVILSDKNTGAITTLAPVGVDSYLFSGSTGGLLTKPKYSSVNPNTVEDNIAYTLTSNEVSTYPANRELVFGVITSDKSLQLIIYNKRLDSISLTSHNVPIEFGCEITGLAVGASIPAQGQATVNIKAKLLSGDSEIAAFCPIYFDKVTIWVYVTISRQPVVIYSLYPDRDSYTESYSCKTNVFTTTSGKERRMSIMVSPKTKVKYKVTSNTPSMASFLENTIYSGLYSEMYQPLWAFASKATQSISAKTAVPCNTFNDIFIPGNYVVIYTSEVEATLSKIVTVTTDTINVLKPISCAAGAWVVPVSLMIPNKSNGGSYESSNGQSHNISLQEYS